MLEVKIVGYDELPESTKQGLLSNNGCGKEYASYLIVYHNGAILRVESSAMEPEDVSFYRDLQWVRDAISEAYDLGVLDGKAN
jgi:hypothetical protein